MNRYLFYVSGHGYGHAVRSALVIETLLDEDPETHVCLKTSAPRMIFPTKHRERLEYICFTADVGVVQSDSLHLDGRATMDRAFRFLQGNGQRIRDEVRFVRERKISLVFGDIPSLAFDVARGAGVPGIGMSNFAWDWIYEDYMDEFPNGERVVDQLKASYGLCDRLLRLPFHGGMDTFPKIEDIPLVVRSTPVSRERLRERYRIPGNRPVVLLSFGGYPTRGLDPVVLAAKSGCTILTFQALPAMPNELVVSFAERSFLHHELVKAADVVVTKPGYGTVAECIAAGSAMLYTDRGRFKEYPFLVEGLARYCRSDFIGRGELLAGDWRPQVEALMARDLPQESLPTDGARRVAHRLSELAESKEVK